LVGALLALAVAGAIYQAIATELAERAYPPPGEMVNVGGHRLHINCIGRGGPAVILGSGLGNMSADWANVQPEVAKTTRVCAYDRAGMGWSEAGPEPRDAKQISGELHTLLKGADIAGPYVLVGHSTGGLYARMYADRYPEEVAGVVLIDSSHPEQFTRPEGRKYYDPTKRVVTVAPWLARLGVIRLFDLNPAPRGLPPKQRAQVEAFNSSTQQLATAAEEFRLILQTSAQVRGTDGLGGKPLVVISAGESSPGNFPASYWLKLQGELASLSSNSLHRVVEGATHTSLLYERSDSQASGAAIDEVVAAVRNDRPLAR
jgi:pimeloyl-ACP methyl ester carboxylesterase